MRKVLLIGLGVVVVLVGGFAAVVAMQPSEFRISRSATMNAPRVAVFAQVNDFHKWEAWSPWAKLDPNARNSFEGPTEGTGSVFKWSGNDEIGEGVMTITESKPAELVRLKLEFVKPMAGTSDTEFTFKPEGDKTVVTWTMSGHSDFLGKAVCLFMDMEKMLGGQFDEGLAKMKTVVESAPKPTPEGAKGS